MSESQFNRRDFNKLSSAALGGLLAGTVGGCTPQGGQPIGGPSTAAAAEVHLCRGLNTCKGKGHDAKNTCAGQGSCATVKEHSCHAQNDCKGQGGCGEKPGENSCKGKGDCSVPLMDSAWKEVRKNLEERLKKDGVAVGPAPKKPAE
jgi:hypothetical protein